MATPVTALSEPTRLALGRFDQAPARALQRAEIELARLLLEYGPPGALRYLELAERFLRGAADATELAEARQECWAYAGSLACGCSLADAETSAAFLAALDSSPASHTVRALAEQAERVLRAGVGEGRMLEALAKTPHVY
jgi:hypothetical protein